MGLLQFVFDTPKEKRTLYLDKDGVINDVVIRGKEASSPQNKGEINLSQKLILIGDLSKREKFNIVIISNQPDISRGIINKQFLYEYMMLVRKVLPVKVAVFCPHQHEMNCNCRKPKGGMISYYRKSYPKTIEDEMYIGDTDKDYYCAASLGINFILKKHEHNKEHQNLNCKKMSCFSEFSWRY